MLSTIKKDKNRRILVKKFEVKKLHAKVFQQDLISKKILEEKYKSSSLPSDLLKENIKASLFIKSQSNLYPFLYNKSSENIPRNSSKTRVKNRCIKSGRGRAVLKFCKLSRIVLREEASKGSIPGLSKASW